MLTQHTLDFKCQDGHREEVLSQLTATCWSFRDELRNQELTSSLCHCFPETVHQSDHLLMLNSQPLNQLMIPAALLHDSFTVGPSPCHRSVCDRVHFPSCSAVCSVLTGACLLSLPCRWPLTPTTDSFMATPHEVCLLPFLDVLVVSCFQFDQWLYFLISCFSCESSCFSWETQHEWGHSLTSLSDAGRKVPHGFYLRGRLIDWLEV